MELKEYAAILKKRSWMIVFIVMIATITAGLVTYYLIPPKYEASTKLIVNRSSQQAGLEQVSLNEVNANIQLIATYKELIRTFAIMDEVVKEYPELDATSDELIQMVNVSSLNETQVMTVSARDPSYERAAKIVNAVSSVFQREVPVIMKVDNVTILNEAKMYSNPVPVSPNLKMNILLSLAESLIFAIAFAFLLEYLDDTIRSEKDIEKYLELPVLAVISTYRKKDYNRLRTRKSKRAMDETTYAYET